MGRDTDELLHFSRKTPLHVAIPAVILDGGSVPVVRTEI